MAEDFLWPSRSEFKKWLGYTELPYSTGNPKKIFDAVAESLEDLGYKILLEPFELKKTGYWEDVAELDAKLYARKEQAGEISKYLKYAAYAGAAFGALFILLGLAIHLAILIIGVLALVAAGIILVFANQTASRSVIVSFSGEARKAVRSRKIKTESEDEVGAHVKNIEEAFLTSDVQIRIGGAASSAELEAGVKEDVATVASKIKHGMK